MRFTKNHSLVNHSLLALSLGAALCSADGLRAQGAAQEDFISNQVLDKMEFRSLGPARFGGRIVDIAVHPQKSATFYAASGSGGLLKTTNNGTSFTQVFDDQPVVSIGDIALAPSAPETIYVGTGEANNQRSSYWGNGVYKSTDGGKTWAHLGLDGTDHIGRIIVHPKDPDTVYVAALGALYRPNNERGVYRSRDGGESWQRVKFINEDVGFVDVCFSAKDPNTIFAASYERRRRAWNFDPSGPGSAIWRSTDAGDTWTRLEGGLPGGEIGRIGLCTYGDDTQDLIFACVENDNPAPPGSAPAGRRGRGRAKVGGEVFRSADGGKTWEKLNERPVGGSPGYYYGQIRVDPSDPQRLYILSVPLYTSADGGKTWSSNGARGVHVDHHALWINPRNPEHLILGNDGGLHHSYDRGRTWDHLNHVSLGQFYAVTVDRNEPYWIYGGTQDNGTWAIPSVAPTSRGANNSHAHKIAGGDGFFVQVDPSDPATVYAESQFGALRRIDLRSGRSKSIRPRPARGQARLRFNWNSPILISHHNPQTVYFGSQFLHRSRNRGDAWETISQDLSTDDKARLAGDVPHCTITCIAESPKQMGQLWVGTDDGKVWLSRNDGERWVDLTDRFEGMPTRLWVSRIETSWHDPEIAYVAFTGYREDIREPFLYVTTDGGETFRPIHRDLPNEPINVVREHPRNAEVLFVGTEFGVHVSLDAGRSWHRFRANLPTIPVHDLIIHPAKEDLILGTHGRGIYVADITPLKALNSTVLGAGMHVFAARGGFLRTRGFDRGYVGARSWTADRHDGRPQVDIFLARAQEGQVTVRVRDAAGTEVFKREIAAHAGLHRIGWRTVRGRRGQQQRGRRTRATPMRPGVYVFEVSLGEQTLRRPFKVAGDPSLWSRFPFDAEQEAGEEGKDEGVK